MSTLDQLTSIDAGWLHAETAETPFHVSNLMLFDKPKQSITEVIQEFRNLLESKIYEVPVLHRKIDLTSMQLGNPVWVVEDNIDWDYHYQEVKVDKPGDQAAVNAAVVKVHQPMLDRRHPLWQMFVLTGLKGGGFAVMMKSHHAAVDGALMNYVLDAIFDEDAPNRPKVDAPEPKRAPNPAELLMQTWKNYWVETPKKMMAAMPELMKSMTAKPAEGEERPNLLEFMPKAPKTIFNKSLVPGRSFGFAHLPLSEVKALGKAHGATINDIVLAVASGTLRRYLEDRGALPDEPLVVGMPVSIRAKDDSTPTNQMFIMMTQLPTNVAEPLDRIPVIKKNVAKAKKLNQALFPMAKMIIDLPSIRYPGLNNMAGMMEMQKAVADLGMTEMMNPMGNLWLSNVPGPQRPLFVAGNPAKTNIPVSLAFHGAALNLTVLSYLDSLDFGVVGSTNVIEDAQKIADLIIDEYNKLKAAMEAQG